MDAVDTVENMTISNDGVDQNGKANYEADTSVSKVVLRDKTNANTARPISTISTIFKGALNFEELITQSRIIADKSMLIKKILQDVKEKAVWFLFPPQWGKTMEASFIDFILRLNPDNGLSMSIDTRIKNLEMNSLSDESEYEAGTLQAKFDRLQLFSNERNYLDQLCKKSASIYISFSLLTGCMHFQDFKETFAGILSNCLCDQFDFLGKEKSETNTTTTCLSFLNSDKGASTKEKLKNIAGEKASEKELREFIPLLCKVLKKYSNNDIILIIDELDAPLRGSYFNVCMPADECEKIRSFYILVIKNILECKYYKKFIAVGVINPLGMLDDSYDVFVSSTLENNSYAKFFGFLQNDVERFYERYALPCDKERMREHCRNWSNGYVIKDGTNEPARTNEFMLYNPTSIREFINHYVAHKDDFNPEFKWVNVHTNDFFPVAEELMETPRVIRLVDSILQKEAPTFPLDTNFSTGTFRLFHKFLKTKDLARPNEEQIQQIVLYLCATGYLIAERVGTDRKKRLPTFKITYSNEQHYRFLEKKLRSFYCSCLNLKEHVLHAEAVQHAFLRCYRGRRKNDDWELDTEEFENALDKYVKALPRDEKEKFFQQRKDDEDDTPMVYGCEDLYHSEFNHLVLALKPVTRFGTEVYKKYRRADTLFIDEEMEIGFCAEQKRKLLAPGKAELSNEDEWEAFYQSFIYRGHFCEDAILRKVFMGMTYIPSEDVIAKQVKIKSFLYQKGNVDSEKLYKKHCEKAERDYAAKKAKK